MGCTMNPALLSSVKMDYGTPWPLFNRLHVEFTFTLDACAWADNAKVPRFYSAPFTSLGPFPITRPLAMRHTATMAATSGVDGLALPWDANIWCNPPYGRALPDWLAKAAAESQAGAPVIVLLTPARPDTRWWDIAANTCSEIRFIQRRIRFQGADQGAAFPSAVLVWRPGHQGPPRYSYMSA